jgi:hypothetical protein
VREPKKKAPAEAEADGVERCAHRSRRRLTLASGFGGVVCSLAGIAIGWNLKPVVIHLLARWQVGHTCERGPRGISAFGTEVAAYIEDVSTCLLTPWGLILRRKALGVFRTE